MATEQESQILERQKRIARKTGRLLTFREMDHGQLVMAKHEDDPVVRTARLTSVFHRKGIARLTVRITNSREMRVEAKATPEGALVDENGRRIYVWEYMNLDGTPFKRSINEPEK
jgi:hypothetical protein